MEILYEDKHILVCKKKPGVPSQSDKSFDRDMVSEILEYRKSKNEEVYCAVINRLDKPVGGIILFAKNKKAAAVLSSSNNYTKEYYLVANGVFAEKTGKFTDYLKKDAKNNISVVTNKNDSKGKLAILDYEVKKEFVYEGKQYSLVKVLLETGRHHQIRVQFSSRGHALFGDKKYSKEPERGNVALCAVRLKLTHPVNGKEMEFEIKPEGTIFEIAGCE